MIEPMSSTPFSPGIRPSDSSFFRAREPCSDQLQGPLRPSGIHTFVRSMNMDAWIGRIHPATIVVRKSKRRSPLKRLIGDALRSREDARRVCEVKIAVKVLNRMMELGRPVCVRVAW